MYVCTYSFEIELIILIAVRLTTLIAESSVSGFF